ncbi:MAG: hypothetical protein J6S67_04610 [Methanobrevibacter sp.]|nr:hypothetical protein [Methanobrevibacter sp.]
MDIFKGLQWFVLIFVFYIFVFYQLFRIIYRNIKESDLGSKINFQKLGQIIIKSRDKIQKSNQKIFKSKNMILIK